MGFLFGLIKFSFVFTVFGSLFRFLQYKNRPKFVNFITKILKVLGSNIFTFSILKFAYFVTNKFFYGKYQKLTKIICCVSGVSLGVGFWLRLLIVNNIFIPFQTSFLIFFALNGIFRAIIGLGLVLTGNHLWRWILERGMQQSGRLGMQPHQSSPKNEDAKNERPENENQDNSEKGKEKTKFDWTKWGAIGSILGGLGGLVSISQVFNNASEMRELRQHNEYLKEKARYEQKRFEIEKEYGEIQKLRAEQLQKQIDNNKKQ